MAEGARLESVCALTTYRGFESHLLHLFSTFPSKDFLLSLAFVSMRLACAHRCLAGEAAMRCGHRSSLCFLERGGVVVGLSAEDDAVCFDLDLTQLVECADALLERFFADL